MCGIAGFVQHDGARGEDLAPMVHALFHRGPDEGGSVVLPEVALGMRRLAIMDVSNRQQPLANEDK